jgi:hypothetical protein
LEIWRFFFKEKLSAKIGSHHQLDKSKNNSPRTFQPACFQTLGLRINKKKKKKKSRKIVRNLKITNFSVDKQASTSVSLAKKNIFRKYDQQNVTFVTNRTFQDQNSVHCNMADDDTAQITGIKY